MIEHQLLKSVLFRTFTRSDPPTGYVFAGQDIDLNPTQGRGSWDVLLISDNVTDVSPPLFVEIKSSFDNAATLIEELRNKISLTREIISKSPQTITTQILQDKPSEISFNFSDAEFVIFTEGTYVQDLIDYIDSNINHGNKMSLVVWGYNFQNSRTQVISIPYIRRPAIKTCKNTGEQGCVICLCIHRDKVLMNFLTDFESQVLESPKIIPSARKYVDPAVNIISILSYGEVFQKEDKNITEFDLKDRISKFLSKFYVSITQDEINRIFDELLITGIILPTRGSPVPSYHLTSSIRRSMTANEKELIADVTKRAIRKLHTRTLDQF
jgi:hypothetical protein